MIVLPPHIAPNSAAMAFIDRGGTLRGASALRVDRLGSHYRAMMTLPTLEDADARIAVSRMIRAKRQGLRVPYPLATDQGQCGSGVVVDGAGQSGSALAVRGLTPRVTVREGYWLSIETADGQHFLHNVGASVMADGAGKAVLDVSDTMLRRPFSDGARVHLVRPMIEGLIEGNEREWQIAVDHRTQVEFTIEEAA